MLKFLPIKIKTKKVFLQNLLEKNNCNLTEREVDV